MPGPNTELPRANLALGGGAARGMAHFGVIRAIEEAGLHISGVAGTSIGAAVGGSYCAGVLEQYELRMRSMTRKSVLALLDPGLPTSGLFGGARLERLMREVCGERLIEELERPFVAVAVDLALGAELRIDQGDLVDAMRASGSIPGLFRPVRRDGRWLVDGALSSPVPLAAARALSPAPLIAVNLNRSGQKLPTRAEHAPEEESPQEDPQPDPGRAGEARTEFNRRLERLKIALRRPRKGQHPGIIEALNESIAIVCNHLTQSQLLLDPPALLIEPRLGDVGMFDLHRTDEMIDEGARAARAALSSEMGRKLLAGGD